MGAPITSKPRVHGSTRRPARAALSAFWRSCAVPAAVAAALLVARPAAADTTSWLSASGGYALRRFERKAPLAHDGYDQGAAISFAIGVGTDPNARVVGGGLLRSTTTLGLGTDLGLGVRIASGSFARGQWGVAFDAGPSLRLWHHQRQYGRYPVQAMLIGGAPWGLELAIGADVANIDGDPQSRGLFVLLGVDLLRLTVMRKGATDKWWENASPAGGQVPRK